MARLPFCFLRHIILTSVGVLTTVQQGKGLSISHLWTARTDQTVTSSSLTTVAQTKGYCVLQCQGMEGCVAAAFDSASSVCHLQPSYRQFLNGDAGAPLIVYVVDSVSECQMSDAPSQISNAHVSQWRVTSSALEGNVICDADYMFSANVTSLVSCQLSTGTWSTVMPATCKQIVWRNDTVNTCSFAVDLDANNGDKPLHVAVRLDMLNGGKTTKLNYFRGQWGPEVTLADPSPPFPFQTGVQFKMKIRAASANKFEGLQT
ncbi:hypothetical protein ACOMHN_011305 [Nucella lapillus]